MNQTKKMKRLLEGMARITQMERGKLCRMSGRPHYNHQTWRKNRNVVRYVPADQAALVQKAIDGYTLFKRLSEQYADEVIAQTRRERARVVPSSKKKKAKRVRQP